MHQNIYFHFPLEFLSKKCHFQIIDHRLHYHFNLGDGNKTLVLSNANITDGKWHNITVRRVGNQATLEMTSNNEIVGRVTGSKGRHQLLDTSGVLYVGGNLYTINGDVEVVDNFQGLFEFHVKCAQSIHLFEYLSL